MDWRGLMQAGICGLGLQPAQFWALTPAELWLMLGQASPAETRMGRSRLEALMSQFPDDTEGR